MAGNLDIARERKSAILQMVGGTLILIAGGGLLSEGSIWQAIAASVAGGYFLAAGAYKRSKIKNL